MCNPLWKAVVLVARTNLHELASRLLTALWDASDEGHFEGKLREVSAGAGLNSVRSAEAVKLLEELGRIQVVQRGRRGRNTVITILSTDPISLDDAESRMASRTARRSTKVSYEDVGVAVVDRLLELARDDGLRSAQVEAFASESAAYRAKVNELEETLAESIERETDLRIKLKASEEALERAEENLRKVFSNGRDGHRPNGSRDGNSDGATGRPVPDDDARAVLDVLRSGRM